MQRKSHNVLKLCAAQKPRRPQHCVHSFTHETEMYAGKRNAGSNQKSDNVEKTEDLNKKRMRRECLGKPLQFNSVMSKMSQRSVSRIERLTFVCGCLSQWCIQGHSNMFIVSSPQSRILKCQYFFSCSPKHCFSQNRSVHVRQTHLEQEDVSMRVAQTEDVFPLGVFGDGLNDAVVCQQSVARRHVLLSTHVFPIGLIKQ